MKYNVMETATVIRYSYFTVEADSEEEALAIVRGGDAEPHGVDEDVMDGHSEIT